MLLEWLEKHQLPCLWKAVFGFECPGCGLQTAVLHLLKGEWLSSLRAWPMLIPVVCYLMLIAVHFTGLKKMQAGLLKNVGFTCLIFILISYLLKIITNNI